MLGLVFDGRYRLDRLADEGGSGVVYQGVDLQLGRPVAIKVLHTHLRNRGPVVERFEREARAAARVDHPNVVHVYHHGETGGQPYLVFAWVTGCPLGGAASSITRPLPWPIVAELGRQLCEGLAALHAADVVHRDVKPANVVLSREGVAVLVDLGLARLANSELTETGVPAGTFAYMAPEQAVDPRTVDGRSDLFSLGVSLLELLTGCRAKPGGLDAAQLAQASADASASPWPRELDLLLTSCRAQAPEQRPSSAEGLAEALQAIALGAGCRPTDLRTWARQLDCFQEQAAEYAPVGSQAAASTLELVGSENAPASSVLLAGIEAAEGGSPTKQGPAHGAWLTVALPACLLGALVLLAGDTPEGSRLTAGPPGSAGAEGVTSATARPSAPMAPTFARALAADIEPRSELATATTTRASLSTRPPDRVAPWSPASIRRASDDEEASRTSKPRGRERVPPAAVRHARLAIASAVAATASLVPPRPGTRRVRQAATGTASIVAQRGPGFPLAGEPVGSATTAPEAPPGPDSPPSAAPPTTTPPRTAAHTPDAQVPAGVLHLVVLYEGKPSWARLEVDGTSRGTTHTLRLPAPAGPRRVVATRPGFREISKAVMMSSTGVTKVYLTLERDEPAAVAPAVGLEPERP